MEQKRWHYVESRLAHQGAGKSVEIDIYIYAVNALKAFDRCKFIPGIKKSDMNDIRQLNSEESATLEKRILDEGLPLNFVKGAWYTTNEDHKQLLVKRLYKRTRNH